MAKLVVLSEGMTGQSYELNVDKTTIGRVEDNSFQIAQPSVSSHHCEVFLRGQDIIIRDLNSTNGTFINGQQITGEAVLKPGQMLRLGTVDLKLDDGTGVAAPVAAPALAAVGAGVGAAVAPSAAPSPAPSRRQESGMGIPKGVSLEQLEQGPQGFDTVKGGFTKKQDSTSKYFIIGGIVFAVVIAILFIVILSSIKPSPSNGNGLGRPAMSR